MKVESRKLLLEDGASTILTISLPDEFRSKIPIIICVPALGVRARYYEPLAKVFTGKGIGFASADLRGNGDSSVRPSPKVDFGYHEILNIDLPAIVGAVVEEFPGFPVILMGHSLGGQLSALFLSSYQFPQIKGLLLMMVASPYYKGWKGIESVAIWLIIHFFKWISLLLGYFPGHILGFAGKEAKSIMIDWSNIARSNKIQVSNSNFDYEESLQNLSIPVLSFTIDTDRLVPYQAAENFLSKIPRATLRHIHLTTKGLYKEKIDHFNWVKKPELFLKETLAWIHTVTADC